MSNANIEKEEVVEQKINYAFDRLSRNAVLDGGIDVNTRVSRLKSLEEIIFANRYILAEAVSNDFGNRSIHETLVGDIFVSLSSIRYARRKLKGWSKKRRRKIDFRFLPAKTYLVPQPLGVVGIIAPWNYPINLIISPLAYAIAAGNRVMLKPSEFTPASASVLTELLGKCFNDEEVVVITGPAEVGIYFSNIPFDHLLFTGSTAVGRQVMSSAALNLTPVTLELGGKSPVVIGSSVKLERAVKAIVQGKLFNSGQTCVAPDYLLLPENKIPDFVLLAKETARKFWPTLDGNSDVTSIINVTHYKRVLSLIQDAIDKGGKVHYPVSYQSPDVNISEERKLPLTIITNVKEEMRIMKEEIFGPLLPLIGYTDIEEAIAFINERPRPLALYIFENDNNEVERVLKNTWSGGVCVNDTMVHAAQKNLPFGGVGGSGMGQYHGREGFDTFTRLKPVMFQSQMNGSWMLRPPYGTFAEIAIGLLLGKRGTPPWKR